jgi:alanyl-tRNA synthetase
MTERLYYTDPYLREFEAVVSRVERAGDRAIVLLDRTAFYPTSGGQPFDVGWLGPARVVEVVDREDGGVAHVVEDAADLAAGSRVRGVIDWPRRFDHMQQHTGQHVLSAAFDHLHHARTVSFHLGAQAATIDLDRELPPAAIAAAVAEANRVVWEDRGVEIRFATAEEASRLPLRKEPVRDGTLRLIDVTGFDLSACGGTHVRRTGAIGIIAASSWERFKGGQRIGFVCGGRALAAFSELRDIVADGVRLMSVGPTEIPEAIGRLQAEGKELRRSLKALQERVAVHEADALARDADVADDVRTVVKSMDGWDANGLKLLAAAIAARDGHRAVLVSSTAPCLVVAARARDVRGDASAVVRALIARFGGKGGGKPELAQGGGLAGPVEGILAAAREAWEA